MNSKTINPLAMLGSYLGLAAGFLLALKDWHLFWWLPALLGLNIGSQIAVESAGGFIAGYILQILWRIISYHGLRTTKNLK